MKENDFRGHGIWSVLEQVETTLHGFSEQAKSDERWSELCDKVEYLRWVLEKSNPSFVSGNDLQVIVNELNNALGHLENDAHNWAHYSHVSNQFGSAFARFPYPRIKKIFRSEINDVIDEFTSTVSEIKGEFEVNRGSSDEAFASLKSKHEELKVFSKEVQQELERLDARIVAQQENWEAAQEARVTAKLSEWGESFSNSQAERNSDFHLKVDELKSFLSEVRSERKEVFDQNERMLEEAKKRLHLQQDEFSQSAEKILRGLEGLYKQAGQVALAGGFVEAATTEHKTFLRYSTLAAGCMFFAAALLAWIWIEIRSGRDASVLEIVLKLPISAVFLVPAFYLASIAARARRSSLAFQSRGLRIKAFDAYLVDADASIKKSLQEKMADVFFIDAELNSDRKNHVSFGSGGRLADILEKVVDKFPGSEPK
ncbi:hypothetical protein [Phaeobacter inhibens]|uniref:hypothetical protein n=1 Tax=Phaeobacter inhibens TaxID=221822 RepID=UPI0021A53341|nr:hypothetical protein [Phaeobacter inhibens]UWS06914.1 hypothetical protein K4K98_11700 [Phaeobacter inhibens]